MDISCSWMGIINIIKVVVAPKLIYKFNIFSIKISAAFFFLNRNWHLIFKIIKKCRDSEWVKESWRSHTSSFQNLFQCNSVNNWHLLLFSCSVMSDSLRPHELQHTSLPCSFASPRACLNSCPLSRWCHPTIFSSGFPLLLLPSLFPSIRVFSNELVLWHQVTKVLELHLQPVVLTDM